MSNSRRSKACLKREQKWAMEGISLQLCRSVSDPPDDPARPCSSGSGDGGAGLFLLLLLSLLLDDLLACLLLPPALPRLRDISDTSATYPSFPDFSSSNRFFFPGAFFCCCFSKSLLGAGHRCDEKTFTCEFSY